MFFLFVSKTFSPKALDVLFLENRGFSAIGVEKRVL
jgi:hypothetical protein